MGNRISKRLAIGCFCSFLGFEAVAGTVLRPDFEAVYAPMPSAVQSQQQALSEPSGGENFDINIQFFLDPSLTPDQQAVLINAYEIAERFFEESITGYIVPPPIPDPNDPNFPNSPGITAVDIDASVVPIDGPGGILGQAGPTNGVTFGNPGVFQNRITYATDGIMEFDTADVLDLISENTLVDVVVHEMWHVLGLGTLWSQTFFDGLFYIYERGLLPGRYYGRNALAKYQEEFDPTADWIPVETGTGSQGTDHGHWAQVSEVWGGGENALMTGFLTSPTYVTETSLFALRDLGYTTLDSLPFQPTMIPVPPAVAALGGALFLLGAAGKLRRRTPAG